MEITTSTSNTHSNRGRDVREMSSSLESPAVMGFASWHKTLRENSVFRIIYKQPNCHIADDMNSWRRWESAYICNCHGLGTQTPRGWFPLNWSRKRSWLAVKATDDGRVVQADTSTLLDCHPSPSAGVWTTTRLKRRRYLREVFGWSKYSTPTGRPLDEAKTVPYGKIFGWSKDSTPRKCLWLKERQ